MPGAAFWGRPRTMVGMLFQSAMMLLRNASRIQHYAADVVIAPEIVHIRPDQMSMAKELYELGKSAAEGEIGNIKELLADQRKVRSVDVASDLIRRCRTLWWFTCGLHC